jgi:hypothetical protein
MCGPIDAGLKDALEQALDLRRLREQAVAEAARILDSSPVQPAAVAPISMSIAAA